MDKATTQNIAIPKETHALLVAHVQKIDRRIWKYVDEAIKEKIDRDVKNSAKQAF